MKTPIKALIITAITLGATAGAFGITHAITSTQAEPAMGSPITARESTPTESDVSPTPSPAPSPDASADDQPSDSPAPKAAAQVAPAAKIAAPAPERAVQSGDTVDSTPYSVTQQSDLPATPTTSTDNQSPNVVDVPMNN